MTTGDLSRSKAQVQTAHVTTPWTPDLQLHERSDGSCRLSLVGMAHGDGATLQEARNDLLVRVFDIALMIRAGRFRFSSEFRPPPPEVMEFLWEVGEIAMRGGDIRERVFAVPSPRTAAD